MSNYISLFVTLIFVYLLSLRGSNTQKTLDDKVVLKFTKLQPVLLIILGITWLVLGVLAGVSYIEEKDTSLLIFSVLSFILIIGIIILFIYFIKKNIIYENDTFYYDNFFQKKKVFKYEDIKRIKYQKLEGVKVYMKNKKKFFINEQMTNFSLIFNKLKEDFWV